MKRFEGGMDYEDYVDRTYFEKLVDAAINDISAFGDFQWFVSDDVLPPWVVPCGDESIEDCAFCSNFDANARKCNIGFDISNTFVKE